MSTTKTTKASGPVLGTVVSATEPSDADVTVTLSQHLDAAQAQYLGLDADDNLRPGVKLRLHKNYVRELIKAGYTTVDPEDGQAVLEVMQSASTTRAVKGRGPKGSGPSNPEAQTPEVSTDTSDQVAPDPESGVLPGSTRD